MTDLDCCRSAIVAKPGERRFGARIVFVPIARVLTLAASGLLVAGCYPHYDWRDYRPDCARSWCGFRATFPGKVTNATRDVPVGETRLPLTINVVSIDDVTFAISSFDLRDGDASAAKAVFEGKLLDDVGATAARRGRVILHGADHQEIGAETFDADGKRGDKTLRLTARFVERPHRLVEILVIGPDDDLSSKSGMQAVETFLTSVRLD